MNDGIPGDDEEEKGKLTCIWCGDKLELSPHQGMHIVECFNCGYDDKDSEAELVKRYGDK